MTGLRIDMDDDGDIEAAFEAGWKARDQRAEGPQRWTAYTDPATVDLLDVPGMIAEDYETYTMHPQGDGAPTLRPDPDRSRYGG